MENGAVGANARIFPASLSVLFAPPFACFEERLVCNQERLRGVLSVQGALSIAQQRTKIRVAYRIREHHIA